MKNVALFICSMGALAAMVWVGISLMDRARLEDAAKRSAAREIINQELGIGKKH